MLYEVITHPAPGFDAAVLRRFIEANEAAVYRVKGHVPSDGGMLYFDYSKAGFATAPAAGGRDHGLAWIVRGGEEALDGERVCTLVGKLSYNFV